MKQLLDLHEILTPDDHQTHRRYSFQVPPDARRLDMWVRYAPKRLSAAASLAVAEQALARQAGALTSRVGETLARQWVGDYAPLARRARVGNLVTISLDDADGVYRGAGHRHSADQHFELGPHSASPGLVPSGRLAPGLWSLTLSAHTLVSDQCEVSIQIGAEIASSR